MRIVGRSGRFGSFDDGGWGGGMGDGVRLE